MWPHDPQRASDSQAKPALDPELGRAIDAGLDEEEILDAARRLVRCRSENPPGDEREAAGMAAYLLSSQGLEFEVVEAGPRRPSVLATWDTATAGPTLLWNGHLDVVPAGEERRWTRPPFAAVVEDGRLYGRGAADMKGAIGSLIGALGALRRSGAPLAGRLLVQAVADEEVLGELGSAWLCARGRCIADAAIVGEPTEMNVGVAERGVAWVRLTTHGRSAHGSAPELGVNAIYHMARFVLAVRDRRYETAHPLLGPPTANVSIIGGGRKINMVPDRCEAEVDRRTIPGESMDSVLEELREIAEQLHREDATFRAEVDPVRQADPCEIDPCEPIATLALAATREVLGREPSLVGMRGATDARLLVGEAGIPTVVWGPGSLDQAHATDEHVAVAELVQAARAYARVIAAFLAPR
ncbi:MAG: M20 family metallopeptidase [Actinomycetota bacterium]